MSLSEDSRTSRQFIAGPDTKTNRQTSTHSSGQIRICVSGFWTEAESGSSRREPTQTQGEHVNSTQKQEASHCGATVVVFPFRKISRDGEKVLTLPWCGSPMYQYREIVQRCQQNTLRIYVLLDGKRNSNKSHIYVSFYES